MDRSFLIGAPRSGTTWLSKIIDAHPDVLYLHEPDSVVGRQSLPPVVHDPVPPTELTGAAQQHIAALYQTFSLKTCGVHPLPGKHYRRPDQQQLFRGMVESFRLLEQIPGIGRKTRRWRLPARLVCPRSPRHTLVKSVIAAGRAHLLAAARPDVRFLLVIRDPRGYVASQVEGARLGKLNRRNPFGELSRSTRVRARGLDEAALRRCSEVELATWYWLMLNEILIHTAAQCANARLVAYDRFCREVDNELDALLAFIGLSRTPEIDRYVAQSTSGGSAKHRFFSLKQDPIAASMRWQTILTAAECDEIEAVVRGTASGEFALAKI